MSEITVPNTLTLCRVCVMLWFLVGNSHPYWMYVGIYTYSYTNGLLSMTIFQGRSFRGLMVSWLSCKVGNISLVSIICCVWSFSYPWCLYTCLNSQIIEIVYCLSLACEFVWRYYVCELQCCCLFAVLGTIVGLEANLFFDSDSLNFFLMIYRTPKSLGSCIFNIGPGTVACRINWTWSCFTLFDLFLKGN